MAGGFFMNTARLPFLVEGILILAAMIFGILLSSGEKPYGKVKLVIHLFLFAWLTTGFVFIVYGLSTIDAMKVIWIPIVMMGLMILTQPVTGILMLASGKKGKALPRIHTVSAILMVFSDICALIIAGLR